MAKKQSRRQFIKKAAYTAPAVMTLKAAPSFATTGSREVQEASRPWTQEEVQAWNQQARNAGYKPTAADRAAWQEWRQNRGLPVPQYRDDAWTPGERQAIWKNIQERGYGPTAHERAMWRQWRLDHGLPVTGDD
jgi:hypothetical protein